jgi:bacterial/archaeal transporter family-2 protein
MSTWMLAGFMIIGGIAVTVQGQFMGIMDTRMGSREGMFITYAAGGILASLIMVFSGSGQLKVWSSVPWYVLSTAGALGLLVVGTMGYTVPRLGLAKSLTIMVAAQLLAALLFDHFGLFGASVRTLNVSRLGGLALMILGVWLVLK